MALDISKGFKFPFDDANWVVKLLIGTVLLIIPIISFFSLGYAYKVFKKALNGEALTLPEWDDWGGYFKQGFLVFVVGLIYLIVPLILILIGTGAFSKATVNLAMGASAGGWYFIGGLFIFIGGLLALIAYLMIPMALAYYAKANEEFGAVFKIKEIISSIFKIIGDYLLVVVVAIGVGIVIGLVNLIPILGIVIYILALFYISLVFMVLFGMACAGAFGAAPQPKA